jgi:hypothetical protein
MEVMYEECLKKNDEYRKVVPASSHFPSFQYSNEYSIVNKHGCQI